MYRAAQGRGKRSMSRNSAKCKKQKPNERIDNTSRRNGVVMRDLTFWLPLINDNDISEDVRGRIKLVKSVHELLKRKQIEQSHILAGFIRIYRKGRKINGDRYLNATL